MRRRFLLAGALLSLSLPLAAQQPRTQIPDTVKILPVRYTEAGFAWTITGIDGGFEKAVVGTDGSISPRPNGEYAVSTWVYNVADGKLYASETSPLAQSLYRGWLPIPQTRWEAGGVQVTTTIFSRPWNTNVVHFYEVRLSNPTARAQRIKLYLALRPYGPRENGMLYQLAFSDSLAYVNDKLAVLADEAPTAAGAERADRADISGFALEGKLPTQAEASAERPSAEEAEARRPDDLVRSRRINAREAVSGAFLYETEIPAGGERRWTFKLLPRLLPRLLATPAVVDSLRALAYDAELARAAEDWTARVQKIKLTLPDERLVNTFYSSLAYILITRKGNMLHPGPAGYDFFWYRDGSYIVTALDRSGLHDTAEDCLRFFADGQRDDGFFPSILDEEGRSLGPPEWDSQGQALWALAEHYRLMRDKAWLRRVFPVMRAGARYLQDLRWQNLKPRLRDTPFYGILPPSASAEDIGPAAWHHYWDDFWGIAGLRDAAWAARELGEAADAEWLGSEYEGLKKDTSASIQWLLGHHNISWIPNGPEDLDSTSAARGTSPGLWPTRVLAASDRLTQNSFADYWKKYFEPHQGVYLHTPLQHFWPYAGLEVGHGMLFLNQPEKAHLTLEVALKYQTAPGFMVWAEQVDTKTYRFGRGDMPHNWMHAEFIHLLRDLLLYEEGDRLVLARGVKREWLGDAQVVAIADAPTHFGKVSYRLEGQKSGAALTLTAASDPPGGYLLSLPEGITLRSVSVDGKPWQDFSPREVRLPAGARTIVLGW